MSQAPKHKHEWVPIVWFGDNFNDDGTRSSWSGEPAIYGCSVTRRCGATEVVHLNPRPGTSPVFQLTRLQKAERRGLLHGQHTHKTLEALMKCKKPLA